MSLLTPVNGTEKKTSKTVFRNTTRCLKLTEDEARLVDEVWLFHAPKLLLAGIPATAGGATATLEQAIGLEDVRTVDLDGDRLTVGRPAYPPR
jgi:hypothetical protein